MYVACRELNLGQGRIAKPGDPVPEALQWDYVTLRSHLNLEWIREAKAEETPDLTCCGKTFKNINAVRAHQRFHKPKEA